MVAPLLRVRPVDRLEGLARRSQRGARLVQEVQAVKSPVSSDRRDGMPFSERTMTTVLAEIMRATYHDDMPADAQNRILGLVQEAVGLDRQQRRGAVDSAGPFTSIAANERWREGERRIAAKDAKIAELEQVIRGLEAQHPRGAVSSEDLDRLLRDVSGYFAGAHVNAGVVLGEIRSRIKGLTTDHPRGAASAALDEGDQR